MKQNIIQQKNNVLITLKGNLHKNNTKQEIRLLGVITQPAVNPEITTYIELLCHSVFLHILSTVHKLCLWEGHACPSKVWSTGQNYTADLYKDGGVVPPNLCQYKSGASTRLATVISVYS